MSHLHLELEPKFVFIAIFLSQHFMSSKLILATCISLLVLIGCSNETQKTESGTYIGGQIINPTSNFLLLKKDDRLIDSIKLDQNNSFLYQFSDPEKGLYQVFHNEGQIIYLEPNDSLLFRVNTFEFDETLTFTGYGAVNNNLIIDLYLQNEEENNLMLQQEIYQQDPETFTRSITKMKEDREAMVSRFLEKYDVSPYFEKIVHAIVDYDFYARQEVYPMSHFGVDRIEFLESFPKSFYSYRDEADFNDASLLDLYSYQRFLINYFNQAAFKDYYKEEPYDPLSFTHNLHKLRIIDSKISNDSVESFLLTRTIRDYLANSNDKKGGQTLYDLYMERIASKQDKQLIQSLYNANKKIETGKHIPNEKLVSANNDTLSIDQIINKPTFIFFWSSARKSHALRAQKLAKSLIQKYPEYSYIAINVNDEFEKWQNTINRYQFDASKQYFFKDSFDELSQDLALNSLLKTFILDRNGIIINAHANIFSSNFENELLQGLNK